MQKKSLNLQSIAGSAFYSLNTWQMQSVLGGKSTPGGTQKNGPTTITRDGNKIITRVPIRSFTADSIENGLTCYEGLEECISETVEYV